MKTHYTTTQLFLILYSYTLDKIHTYSVDFWDLDFIENLPAFAESIGFHESQGRKAQSKLRKEIQLWGLTPPPIQYGRPPVPPKLHTSIKRVRQPYRYDERVIKLHLKGFSIRKIADRYSYTRANVHAMIQEFRRNCWIQLELDIQFNLG